MTIIQYEIYNGSTMMFIVQYNNKNVSCVMAIGISCRVWNQQVYI